MKVWCIRACMLGSCKTLVDVFPEKPNLVLATPYMCVWGGRQVLPSNQVDTSLEKLCILHSLTCSQPPYILLQIVNTFSGSYSGVECAADSVLSDVAIKLGLGGITDGAAPWEAYIHVKNCLHNLYTRYMTIYFPVGNSMTNT